MSEAGGDKGGSFFPATAMPDEDWWSALWPDPEGVLKKLGVREGEAALDLCCGDGRFTAPLARLASPAAVYALDLDPEMVEKAREHVAARGESCVFIAGDAMDFARRLPERVGFVFMANTFHGVPDKAGLAREVYGALSPGGVFAVVNWHPAPREKTTVHGEPRGPATPMRMSVGRTREAVESAGFETERVVELPPYHYGAIFRKQNTERRPDE